MLVIVDCVARRRWPRSYGALRKDEITRANLIVAISAVTDDLVERDCVARGADVFLAESLGPERFGQVVSGLVLR